MVGRDVRLCFQTDEWYDLFAGEVIQCLLPDYTNDEIQEIVSGYAETWNSMSPPHAQLDIGRLVRAVMDRRALG